MWRKKKSLKSSKVNALGKEMPKRTPPFQTGWRHPALFPVSQQGEPYAVEKLLEQGTWSLHLKWSNVLSKSWRKLSLTVISWDLGSHPVSRGSLLRKGVLSGCHYLLWDSKVLFVGWGLFEGTNEMMCVNVLCELQSVTHVTRGDDSGDTKGRLLGLGLSRPQFCILSPMFLQRRLPFQTPLVTGSSVCPMMKIFSWIKNSNIIPSAMLGTLRGSHTIFALILQ
jgi:hypothetical protein